MRSWLKGDQESYFDNLILEYDIIWICIYDFELYRNIDFVTFDKARLKMDEKSWTRLLNPDEGEVSSLVVGTTNMPFFLFLLYGDVEGRAKVSLEIFSGPDLWRRLAEDLVFAMDGPSERSAADFIDLLDRRRKVFVAVFMLEPCRAFEFLNSLLTTPFL